MTIVLLTSDLIISLAAFLIAYYLRNKGFFRFFLDSVQPIEVYLLALPFALLLLLIVLFFSGLYQPKNRLTSFSESFKLFGAITVWALLIMAGSYLYKYDYSRIIVFLYYILTLFFIILGRFVIRKFSLSRVNILVIGAGKPGREIARRLERYHCVGFNLVGFLDNDIKNEKVLGKLSSLKQLIEKYSIHEVYITDPSLSHQKILSLVAKCSDAPTKFKITSNIFSLVTGSFDIANIETIPSLDLSRAPFSLWKRVYKRSLDLLFASIGVLVTLPIWLLIILVIKLESAGQAILTQERVGLKGVIFRMYKFRTMYQESSLYQKPPQSMEDKRITKVGKFLRKTSLDELPQLLNILRGDMSIVGPRPEMTFIARRHNKWAQARLLVKPGLTGLWQILGRKDLPLSQNLEYDFYYINNQSLILDLVIIIKTVPLIFTGKGAY